MTWSKPRWVMSHHTKVVRFSFQNCAAKWLECKYNGSFVVKLLSLLFGMQNGMQIISKEFFISMAGTRCAAHISIEKWLNTCAHISKNGKYYIAGRFIGGFVFSSLLCAYKTTSQNMKIKLFSYSIKMELAYCTKLC